MRQEGNGFRLDSDSPQLPKLTDKQRKRLYLLGAFLLVVILLRSLIAPYIEYLWFAEDARQPRVFLLPLQTSGFLFTVAFLFALTVLLLNLRIALRPTVVYFAPPSTLGQKVLADALEWLSSNGQTAAKLISLVVAILFGKSMAGQWNDFLLWSNGEAFNRKDPMFGLDLGFFVFKLPFLMDVALWLTGLTLITTGLCWAAYAAVGSISRTANVELANPKRIRHLQYLAASFLLCMSIVIFIGRYAAAFNPGAQFTGAGYVAERQIAISAIQAFLGIVCAAALCLPLNKQNRPQLVQLTAAGLFMLSWVVNGLYGAITQRFVVEPNKLNLEAPYAKRAIESTRWAYGLDQIQIREIDVKDAPTPQEVRAAEPTLQAMRLWDPALLRESIEGIQGLRPYYRFHDVDVDRYTIGAKQQLVMLSPRDIEVEGLNPNARSWVNQRLQYTHGFGITMSPVHQSTAAGLPQFLVRDIPPRGPDGIKLDQPRIYYSDFQSDFGGRKDPYVIVNTKDMEFDYPAQNDSKTYRWTGERGIRVGSFLNRLALAVELGDGNLFWSPNITNGSRILLRRNVLQRSEKMFPFLSFDSDPYIVAAGGRLRWIIDAYTSARTIPYSDFSLLNQQSVNYIRNSVKVVIDAYSGETTAFAFQPNEPILKAYRNIYPGLIQDAAKLPTELVPHLRFPEQMFMLQSRQLTQYHVTEPKSFLNNEDAWEMPSERGRGGVSEPMEAYYVVIQLPGEAKPQFRLILPFTPRLKGNMSGWLAADCDPESYGKLTLFKYPKGSNMPGPAQMEANINQDDEVANLNKLLNSDQSELVPGNLIVVPIGQSVMYVKPQFLKSRSQGIQAIPELKKVVLALNGDIVVADTYAAALSKLFGRSSVQLASETPGTEAPSANPAPQSEGPGAGVSRSELSELLRLSEQADAALKSGDLATYAELHKRLQQRLRELTQKGSN